MIPTVSATLAGHSPSGWTIGNDLIGEFFAPAGPITGKDPTFRCCSEGSSLFSYAQKRATSYQAVPILPQ